MIVMTYRFRPHSRTKLMPRGLRQQDLTLIKSMTHRLRPSPPTPTSWIASLQAPRPLPL